MLNSDEYSYLDDDFARELIDLGNQKPDNKPILYYDQDGDFIEFLAEQDSHNSERVSSVLTVYYSTKTGKMIGSKIKGVKSILKKYSFLAIRVKDQKVRLDHLILIGMIGNVEAGATLMLEYEKVYPSLMELIAVCGQNFEIPELCLTG